MSEKKLAQIAVHVSDETKCLVARFADAEGKTVSEYVHGLIDADVEQKRSLMQSLREAFAKCDRTISSGEQR